MLRQSLLRSTPPIIHACDLMQVSTAPFGLTWIHSTLALNSRVWMPNHGSIPGSDHALYSMLGLVPSPLLLVWRGRVCGHMIQCTSKMHIRCSSTDLSIGIAYNKPEFQHFCRAVPVCPQLMVVTERTGNEQRVCCTAMQCLQSVCFEAA